MAYRCLINDNGTIKWIRVNSSADKYSMVDMENVDLELRTKGYKVYSIKPLG